MSEDARVLAHRYEVGDLIGRGGMAEVHIGYDNRLGRTVAIKILRSDLARDPSFLTRFRREAQAAAGLNHPSIVAVYDTGEEQFAGPNGARQTIPFIVMEYVEGHTVRDILKDGAAAPIDEAVEILTGVLSALEYSHAAGLVHRDIKPANVMLTPTGAVKVMDFGIARAMADVGQTMTQTQAVVGTAQYLSPEQARGEAVDTRSDLYSAGCLLFELLCGRPPFVGDSPVSVAYQHVREAAPKPSDFAPDVPSKLDQVVLRALAKDRNARYATAQEFLADLNAVMAGTALVPTTGQIKVGSAGTGSGATAVAAAAAGNLDPATKVMAPPGPGGPATPGGHVPEDEFDEYVDEAEDRKRKIRTALILVGSAIVAGLVIFGLYKLATPTGTDGPGGPGTVIVPDVVGTAEADAVTTLESFGLEPTVAGESHPDIPEGAVVRTVPEAEVEVDKGSEITVYVSTGALELTIPSVRGLTEDAARAAMTAAGLTTSASVEDHNDPFIDEGRVTRTEPEEGSVVGPETEVTIYVSSGKVELPDLVGVDQEDATAWLLDLRLKGVPNEVQTNGTAPGEILSQSPEPGLVDVFSEVMYDVAVPVVTVPVPDLVNKTQGAAIALLNTSNLGSTVVEVFSDVIASGSVVSSDPTAGTVVAEGTVVTIEVSKGPEPDPDPDPSPSV